MESTLLFHLTLPFFTLSSRVKSSRAKFPDHYSHRHYYCHHQLTQDDGVYKEYGSRYEQFFLLCVMAISECETCFITSFTSNLIYLFFAIYVPLSLLVLLSLLLFNDLSSNQLRITWLRFLCIIKTIGGWKYSLE